MFFVSTGTDVRRIFRGGFPWRWPEETEEGTIYRAPSFWSECGKVFVEMRDGLDAAVIIFESKMLVGSVGVFVG